MSVNPTALRSESHERIGGLLQDHAGTILERWQRRALAEQPHADRAHAATLLDHFPRLLQAIGESLMSQDSDVEAHTRQASFHGIQRWDAGWSLSEVVRDYQILRLVVLDFLDESLQRPMRPREIMAMCLVLDDAIGASVRSYVDHRDRHLRHLEQQRANQEREARQHAEKALRDQADALQALDRRKNEFLALVGHELRNPLGAIVNSLELMRVVDPGHPDRAKASDILTRQVAQMQRLVDDLLDITRVSRGMLELRRQEVELTAAVLQAAAAVRSLVDSRDHHFKVSVPDEPILLDADPDRLAQILTNLLVNAARYTPPGGRIELSAASHGNFAEVRVRDNGVGIAADMLPRIFDMFSQADGGAVAHSEGGLGLGLALVKSLVELHGGQVAASSDGNGRGSEFVVRLPLRASHPQVVPAKAASLPMASIATKTRFLVVDDNHDVVATMAALLRKNGHEVHTAHDGPSAIELAARCQPRIVLIDIGLPGMNGYRVAEQLRAAQQGQRLLLVALTGYGQEEARRLSEQAGFDHHLVKPVVIETLLHLIGLLPA